jgi:hypothetical protein
MNSKVLNIIAVAVAIVALVVAAYTLSQFSATQTTLAALQKSNAGSQSAIERIGTSPLEPPKPLTFQMSHAHFHRASSSCTHDSTTVEINTTFKEVTARLPRARLTRSDIRRTVRSAVSGHGGDTVKFTVKNDPPVRTPQY